jgi:hypothetical protein
MTGARMKVIMLCLALLAGYLAWAAMSRTGRAGRVCEVPVIVEVLNGCGLPGIADRVAERLRDGGFDVMFIGNADDFNYASTLVVDRSGDRSKALAVACAVGDASVICQMSSAAFVDATVVIGADLAAALSADREHR